MTTAERLLDLVLEYQAAKEDRSRQWGEYSTLFTATSRNPEEIAAEYARTLRGLLAAADQK